MASEIRRGNVVKLSLLSFYKTVKKKLKRKWICTIVEYYFYRIPDYENAELNKKTLFRLLLVQTEIQKYEWS